MTVSTDTGIREGYAIASLHHRRHLLQVDLVHDAIARRDHVHVLERGLGPVDEVETVVVAAVFDGTVLLERVLLETCVLDGQGVVHDQLGGNDRVDLGGIPAFLGNGIAQAGQVHQRGLAQDVVAYDTGRIPREVQIPLTLDQLLEGIGQHRRITAANQLLGQDTGGVREFVVGTGLDVFDRLAGVEVVQVGARELFAVFSVHAQSRSSIGSHSACSGPV